MKEKKQNDVRLFLKNLADYLNVKGIRGVAEFLGVKESRLYSWIHRGSIGDKPLLLAKIPTLRKEYLQTGKGEMFAYTPPKGDSIHFSFGENKKNETNNVSISYFPDIYAAAGEGFINYNEAPTVMNFDKSFLELQFGAMRFENLHIIHAVGDSMLNSIAPGDLLFVNPGEKEIQTGAVYVIRVAESIMVKRVEQHPITKKVTLKSDNPDYSSIDIQDDDLDLFAVIGRVIGNLKKL